MSQFVLKFGGSSIATIEKMKNVATYINERRNLGDHLVVVLSAMANVTNSLIKQARNTVSIPNKRDLDLLLATGEVSSISLMSMILNNMNCPAIPLMGFQAGIITKGEHSKSEIVDINIQKIEEYLAQGKVVVVAGFQGINEEGFITTLGRGGSDTTAVALAAKLQCPCEIYTDVAGIYRVDPKEYCKAHKLDKISYQVMKALAFLGAKVMEPRSIEIGEKFNVEIYVTNNEGEGTYITKEAMEKEAVTGIAINEKLLNVRLELNNVNPYLIINEIIAGKISIEQINYSKSYITFIIDANDLGLINQIISNYPEIIKHTEEIVKVSLVGKMIRNNKVILTVLNLLNDNNISYHEILLLEQSISIVTNRLLKAQVVGLLANYFNL